MSESAKGGLAKALAAACAKARGVEKDAKNKFHGYDYASAEVIYAEAKLALEGCGLALVPVGNEVAFLPEGGDTRLVASPTKKNRDGSPKETLEVYAGPRFELRSSYLLVHESGESLPLSCSWPIVPESGRPLDKATASARTTSLSYLLRDLLGMPRVDKTDNMDHGRRGRDLDPSDCRPCEGTGEGANGPCEKCGGSGVAAKGPAGRKAAREPVREESRRAEPENPEPAKTPTALVGPPALDAESVFRAAERTTLALVLERLQDALVAQQLLDPKRDPGVIDPALTAAVSKAAQAQGWPDSEIKNLWARVGKEPKRGAALVQVKAFVALLPERKVPA